MILESSELIDNESDSEFK